MKRIKWILIIALANILPLSGGLLHAERMNSFGQVLKISTNLTSFVGKPSWLLIIRDVDHGQNIPYLFDFTGHNNYWLAFTFGRNYLITASELTFNPMGRKTKDFCGLESRGAILRGTSMDIIITGKLSPDTNRYNCNVLKYTDPNFTIGKSE